MACFADNSQGRSGTKVPSDEMLLESDDSWETCQRRWRTSYRALSNPGAANTGPKSKIRGMIEAAAAVRLAVLAKQQQEYDRENPKND